MWESVTIGNLCLQLSYKTIRVGDAGSDPNPCVDGGPLDMIEHVLIGFGIDILPSPHLESLRHIRTTVCRLVFCNSLQLFNRLGAVSFVRLSYGLRKSQSNL